MKLAFWWKSWRIISHYVHKILFLRATPSKTWSSRVDCRDLAKSIDIGSRNEGLSMTSTIMSTIWQFDIESSQGMKTTIWLFITLLLIPMGSTVGKWDFFYVSVSLFEETCFSIWKISELAVSTKSDITIFFNNGNEKTISFDKGTVLDFSQVENTTKALVKKSTALLEDRLIWTNFLDEEDGKNDEKTFPFIPGVQKLLPFSTRHMIAANQTSLLSVNVDNDEVRLLYQGTKILDVAFDACSNSLLMIDNKQVFISSLQHFNPIPVLSFTQLLLPKNTKGK